MAASTPHQFFWKELALLHRAMLCGGAACYSLSLGRLARAFLRPRPRDRPAAALLLAVTRVRVGGGRGRVVVGRTVVLWQRTQTVSHNWVAKKIHKRCLRRTKMRVGTTLQIGSLNV